MTPSRSLRGMILTPTENTVDGLATYQAVFQGSANPSALSKAFGGAGRTQFATVYHTAGAAKDVRIREVLVAVSNCSATISVETDLVRLGSGTTPATGNPAITPTALDPNDVAAEAVCLALPTTPGSEFGRIAKTNWDLAATGTGSTVNPPPPLTWVVLYAATLDEQKPLLLRRGVAEGIAVVFDVSGAATVKGFVLITFTEETNSG